MEKIVLYRAEVASKDEIAEALINKGYQPFFADNIIDLLTFTKGNAISKVCISINHLSDIRCLHTITSINNKFQVILVAPSDLNDIIELLKEVEFTLLSNILQISDSKSFKKP